MNADKLWHTYNKFRLRKTKQFAPSIYKALQSQIKYYAATQDLINLPQQPMQEVLMDLYKDVGRIYAANTFYSLLKDAGIRYKKPEVNIKRNGSIGINQEFIDAILDFFSVDMFGNVQNITQTTRNQIQKIVEEGVHEWLSLDEIINNLLTSGITKNRAAVISRTEIGKAANAATDIGVKKTGLLTNKVWISVSDHRTRPDHVHVNNQIQPADKPFIVGNERFLMMHPMDTTSEDGRRVPGKEIINCRCTFGHIVLKDKHGLPLRKTGLGVFK
jgi:hypothetical protein